MVASAQIDENERFKLEQTRWGTLACLIAEPNRNKDAYPLPFMPWDFFRTGEETPEQLAGVMPAEFIQKKCDLLALTFGWETGYDPAYDETLKEQDQDGRTSD